MEILPLDQRYAISRKGGRRLQRTKTRVLIVEDERRLLESLRHLLGTRGYEVITAGDVKNAILMLEQHDFDAIVLDLVLLLVDSVIAVEFFVVHPGYHDELEVIRLRIVVGELVDHDLGANRCRQRKQGKQHPINPQEPMNGGDISIPSFLLILRKN